MIISTKREVIQTVLDKWERQYPVGSDSKRTKITAELKKLDLNTCSGKEIISLIGNGSWTRLSCDECQKDVDLVMGLGKDEDGCPPLIHLCKCCLAGALAQLEYYQHGEVRK